MSPIEETLAAAHAHHQAGRLPQAAALYKEALEQNPEEARALAGIGAILLQGGQAGEAVEVYRRACRGAPGSAEMLFNLATAQLAAGRAGQAEASLGRALALKPDFPEARCRLAELMLANGETEAARRALLEILAEYPDQVAALFNLGNLCLASGELARAEGYFRRAAELAPGNWRIQANLGGLLKQMGRPAEAVRLLRGALLLEPGNPAVLNNLGNAHLSLGDYPKAARRLAAAAKAMPKNPSPQSSLALALFGQGLMAESVEALGRALELNPDHPTAQVYLSMVLRQAGEPEEALAASEKLLRENPDLAAGRLQRATCLLAAGELERAWPDWWAARRQRPAPDWPGLGSYQGQEGRGGVVLWCDEGLVDSLLFLRLAPLLAQRVGEVRLFCPQGWRELLAETPGISGFAARGEALPGCRWLLPLSCLGAALACSPALVPHAPWLPVRQELVEKWRRDLGPARGLRVGLARLEDSGALESAYHHVPEEALSALAQVEGVELVWLQADQPPENLPARPLPRGPQSAPDVLALLASMDLLILPEGSFAELAGAAGLTAWVVLARSPGWSWGLAGESVFWRPGLRLFRQPAPGDWEHALGEAAAALARRAAEGR